MKTIEIQELLNMEPYLSKDPRLYRSLAESLAFQEDWKGARQVYRILSDFSVDVVWVQKQIAKTFRQEGHYSAALEIYQKLVWLDQAGEQDLICAAELAENLRRWKEALGLYHLIEDTKQPAYVMSRMGYVYEMLQEEDLAEGFYQEAVYLKADYPLAYIRLALIKWNYHKETAFELAQMAIRKSLGKMVFLQNKLPQYLNGFGDELPNPAENSHLMEKAREVRQITRKAFAFLSEHFPEEEVSPFLCALVEEYPSSGKLYYFLGKHFEYHSKYEEAENWYQKAILKNEELKLAHLALGGIYEKTRNDWKAILAYEKVLRLDGQNRKAYGGLIRLYQQQGQLEQLWPKWLARYRAGKNNVVLREHLIEALHKNGEYELAKNISKEE